eukprot:6209886-Pleurochrysis_carterae.AAC.1
MDRALPDAARLRMTSSRLANVTLVSASSGAKFLLPSVSPTYFQYLQHTPKRSHASKVDRNLRVSAHMHVQRVPDTICVRTCGTSQL